MVHIAFQADVLEGNPALTSWSLRKKIEPVVTCSVTDSNTATRKKWLWHEPNRSRRLSWTLERC